EGTINRDETSHMLRIQPCVLTDDRRSHAVADEDDAVRLCFGSYCLNCAREQIHRQLTVLRKGTLAMSGQVERHDAVLVLKGRHLRSPRRGVAGPAVDEDHRRLAITRRR